MGKLSFSNGMDLDEFIKLNDLDFDYELNTESSMLNEDFIGFMDEESQACGYFEESMDGNYPDTVYIFDEYLDGFKDLGIEKMYILGEWSGDDSYYTLYDNYEKCKSAFDKLKNSRLPSIESIIDDFNKNTDHMFEVVPKFEISHPHGYWTSYNIYYEGNLIYDGAFKLDDELAFECKAVTETINSEINGYYISNITKQAGTPSWEKFYEVELDREGFSTTLEVSLHFHGQKLPRNVLNVIENEIDWDDIDEQFEMYQKEGEIECVTI